jgi:hypothetical protein
VRYVLQIALGIAILVLLFVRVFKDFSTLKAIKIDFLYFFLGIISYMGLHIVLSYRIKFLIGKMQSDASFRFKCIFASHLGGMIVGDVTPGRSGYLATSKFLNNLCKCDMERGLAAIIAPQGVEFLLKGLSAALAIVYIFSKLPTQSFVLFISAALVIAIGVIILSFSWMDEHRSRRLVEKVPYLAKHAWRIGAFKGFSQQIKPYVPHIIALYTIGWIFTAFQWYFIGSAIGLPLTFIDYFLLHPLITTLTFVPLTPAGLGIMESGAILVFYVIGIASPEALIFSILARTSNLVGDLPGLYPVLKSISRSA